MKKNIIAEQKELIRMVKSESKWIKRVTRESINDLESLFGVVY